VRLCLRRTSASASYTTWPSCLQSLGSHIGTILELSGIPRMFWMLGGPAWNSIRSASSQLRLTGCQPCRESPSLYLNARWASTVLVSGRRTCLRGSFGQSNERIGRIHAVPLSILLPHGPGFQSWRRFLGLTNQFHYQVRAKRKIVAATRAYYSQRELSLWP
jgi:hypothetical protein